VDADCDRLQHLLIQDTILSLVFFLRCLCSCDYSPRRSKQWEGVPTVSDGFREFFQAATNRKRYDYQRRLAGDPTLADAILDGPKSLAINVPTGCNVAVACQSRSGH